MRFRSASPLVRRTAAAAAFLALAAAGAPAAGQFTFREGVQDACVGEISSLARAPLPAGKAYDVDIYDDTDENLRFRDAFLAAMREAGYEVADGGPLVFTFEPQLVSGGQPIDMGSAPGYVFDAPERVGTNTGIADGKLNWLPNVGRQVDRERADSGRADTVNIVVSARLRDSEDRRDVWLAAVSCQVLNPDAVRMNEAIIPPLIDSLGRTIERRPLQ